MDGVQFMDSTGTGALIRARDLFLNHAAEIRLAGVPRSVQRVLEISGLAEACGLA